MNTLLLVCTMIAGQATDVRGTIAGTVLNGSDQNAPAAEAEVVLCIDDGGQRVPVESTTADSQGRFLFQDLPLGENMVYLPGTNRGGVHYSGPRVRLGAAYPHAQVRLIAFDATSDPSPLVALHHNVTIRAERGALRITESMLIDNPSRTAYVGESVGEMPPVTLRLSIPEDFEKATFHKEFFGRQFLAIDGRLVTSIPWPPGQRKLEFTYVLPVERSDRPWRRRLDLPARQFSLRVATDDEANIRCELPRQETGAKGEVTFVSPEGGLPADRVIELQMGRLPLPIMTYAKWIALVVLGTLVAFSLRLLKERSASAAVGSSTPARSVPAPHWTRRGKKRAIRIGGPGETARSPGRPLGEGE